MYICMYWSTIVLYPGRADGLIQYTVISVNIDATMLQYLDCDRRISLELYVYNISYRFKVYHTKSEVIRQCFLQNISEY